MKSARPDPGSFRDPGGRVLVSDDRVLRAIYELNAPAYRAARELGLYEKLAEQGLLVPAREVPTGELGPYAAQAEHALEHPRLPFLSYPYEWSFALHRAAALLHLDLHLAALDLGFTLSDATAYNVQFAGTRPVFIDHLSLRPYREGELWDGHRQFCMQFLNPLLLWTAAGVPPNAWFRGSLEGIAPEDLSPLLPLRKKLSWTVLCHVVAQAALQRRIVAKGNGDPSPKKRHLPRDTFIALLKGLRGHIERMRPPVGSTVWADYAQSTSYSSEEVEAKRAFVHRMVETTRPTMLFDLGCNTGDYSEVAFAAGAEHVIGFDYDHAALDQAYTRFRDSGRSFLPLWLDAANPTPSQGWAQGERQGLAERARADALIALALIHHIVIGRNVPLDMAVGWIVGLAPTGVIEFPPKSDPMVARLLSSREDVFSDYGEEAFLSHLGRHARIVATQRVSEHGRLLAWYDRRI